MIRNVVECHHHCVCHFYYRILRSWSFSSGDRMQCCGVCHHHRCHHYIMLCSWSFSSRDHTQCCGVYHYPHYHHCRYHHCYHHIVLCPWSFSSGDGALCGGVWQPLWSGPRDVWRVLRAGGWTATQVRDRQHSLPSLRHSPQQGTWSWIQWKAETKRWVFAGVRELSKHSDRTW